jgi:hypothetical protein
VCVCQGERERLRFTKRKQSKREKEGKREIFGKGSRVTWGKVLSQDGQASGV